jgi:hypothetical protein
MTHHDYYKGSIVHRYSRYDKPQICANCIRWSKSKGCDAGRKSMPEGHCEGFSFARYANYRLDKNGKAVYIGAPSSHLESNQTPQTETRKSEYLLEGQPAGQKETSNRKEGKRPSKNQVADEAVKTLRRAKLEVVDKRAEGGALWVIGGEDLRAYLLRFKKYGLSFHFKKDGGRTSGRRPAWWCK